MILVALALAALAAPGTVGTSGTVYYEADEHGDVTVRPQAVGYTLHSLWRYEPPTGWRSWRGDPAAMPRGEWVLVRKGSRSANGELVTVAIAGDGPLPIGRLGVGTYVVVADVAGKPERTLLHVEGRSTCQDVHVGAPPPGTIAVCALADDFALPMFVPDPAALPADPPDPRLRDR